MASAQLDLVELGHVGADGVEDIVLASSSRDEDGPQSFVLARPGEFHADKSRMDGVQQERYVNHSLRGRQVRIRLRDY